MQFPTVSGYNLRREQVTFPRDLTTQLSIIVVAFHQWQQAWVDTWIPFLNRLEAGRADLTYYELPTIRSMNILSRTFINEGMRMGIPDNDARKRTVTLYLDKEPFRRELAIGSESTITLLLVNRQGNILWRTTGKYTPEKYEALTTAINETGGVGNPG
jgi:hypothetical protein